MSVEDRLYIAVDLGAGSGRVFLAGVAPGEWLLEEAWRFHYPPRREASHLRWDARRIVAEVRTGLRVAGKRAKRLGRPVRSVGVDSWGVDYGLVDAGGVLLENPVCYRDERTAGVMEEVFARMPREELFARTGVQILPINTLFQLYAHAKAGLPVRASRLLLIADLVAAALTGRAVTEYTNGSTSQLFDAATGTWDDVIVDRLGLPARLLGEVVRPGETIGPLLPEVAAGTGLSGVPVVAPATHDTGSAVAGAPLEDGWAYVSSGTWSLVGVERDRVLIDADVARHNFTNEGGAFGTTRFLKNVMGLWILERCREEWRAGGLDVGYDTLLRGAAALERSPGVIFPDDPRFLNPSGMLSAIGEQMRDTRQSPPADPAAMTKVILDSLALRYGSVLRTIESLDRRRIHGVRIVGGGSQNAYLNQATATVTGLPVLAGPVEATVAGNVLVQAIAAGRFGSLAEARRHLAQHVRPATFAPGPFAGIDHSARRYAEIEARFAHAGGLTSA